MYDDDEYEGEEIVEEEQPIYEIIEDDDEDAYEDDTLGEHDDDVYAVKGKDDRSFVDQQRLDYDEEKRKKRTEIAKLRAKLQVLQGHIAKKERELRDLNIQLQKEDFREMKEGVVEARKEAQAKAAGTGDPGEIGKGSTMSAPGIEFTGTDMDVEVLSPAVQKRVERETKRNLRVTLEQEIATLREQASSEERTVSQLEHQLLRS